MLLAIMQFIPDEENPVGLVSTLLKGLPSGSYLVLSHVTGDGRETGTLTDIGGVYQDANAPLIMRTRDQVTAFFNGLELIEPGVVFLSQWRPTGEYFAQGGTRWGYCGVGKKP